MAEPPRDDPGRLRFVPRIRVRVEEHDGDRRDAGADELLRARLDLPRIELRHHGAVGAHALSHLEAQVARHERLRLFDVDVVEVELPLAADLERVGEARRRDQSGRGTLPLDERIGEERRRVHDAGDVGGIDRAVPEQGGDAGGHGAGRIVVGREHLLAPLATTVVVVDDQIGEGAADVDAERRARHAATS